MPAEDIGQVLLKCQAPGSLVMELKSFFPLGVMSGQRAFGKPGLVHENPLYPMTSVTEGEVCVLGAS